MGMRMETAGRNIGKVEKGGEGENGAEEKDGGRKGSEGRGGIGFVTRGLELKIRRV
jgi:hypothetical protein